MYVNVPPSNSLHSPHTPLILILRPLYTIPCLSPSLLLPIHSFLHMEAKEESILAPQVMKGKRTKRPRLFPPPPAVAPASSMSSDEITVSTAEEEDMANCLILLSRGPQPDANTEEPIEAAAATVGAREKLSSKRFAEAATTNGKAGFFVYECKTCSKCFPSFQALGGHRASHKKLPKLAALMEPPAEEAKTAEAMDEETIQLCMNSFSNSVAICTGKVGKVRIHECSICGSEFASGQALGGHMRRHRQASVPETKKEKSVLSLDLNLPAPADDCSRSAGQLPTSPTAAAATAFSFARKPHPLMLSPSSALVDCHY